MNNKSNFGGPIKGSRDALPSLNLGNIEKNQGLGNNQNKIQIIQK